MPVELAFRPHTWDRDIWNSVAIHNEYQLAGPFTPEDSVLDIGAHIGSFAYKALDLGAGRVLCVEPDPDSFNFLRHNLHSACGATDRAVLLYGAAVASKPYQPHGPIYVAPVGTNTGGSNTIGQDGIPVAGLELAELIRLATCHTGAPLSLMKMDCEGMEWQLLERGDYELVEAIVGEWHGVEDPSLFPMLQLDGPRRRADLIRLLRRQGFTVATHATGPYLGLFWGWREGCSKFYAHVQPDS